MGKTLYLSPQAARLADPIIRAELDRVRDADDDWARVLDHLADAGPSTADDLLVELGLERRRLKATRSPLERCGVLVGRWEDERNVLYRWDQLGVEPGTGPPDLAALVVAAVAAAVVVPEREPRRWFSWRWRWDDDLLDELVKDGRLVRPSPGWLAASS
jgi:hypothetical protein